MLRLHLIEANKAIRKSSRQFQTDIETNLNSGMLLFPVAEKTPLALEQFSAIDAGLK